MQFHLDIDSKIIGSAKKIVSDYWTLKPTGFKHTPGFYAKKYSMNLDELESLISKHSSAIIIDKDCPKCGTPKKYPCKSQFEAREYIQAIRLESKYRYKSKCRDCSFESMNEPLMSIIKI